MIKQFEQRVEDVPMTRSDEDKDFDEPWVQRGGALFREVLPNDAEKLERVPKAHGKREPATEWNDVERDPVNDFGSNRRPSPN